LLVARLHSTAAGAAWLLARWAELRDLLEQAGYWDVTALAAATRLLGGRPEAMAADHTAARLFAAAFLAHPAPRDLCDGWAAAHPGRDVHAAFGHARPHHDALGSRTPALAALRQAVADEVARLEARKRLVLDPRAALDRAEAADRAMFDDSQSGVLLRRYMTACEREYHKALAAVLKFRQARAAEPEVEAEPEPPAAAAGEPVRNEPIAEGDGSQEVLTAGPVAEPVGPAAPPVNVFSYMDETPPTPVPTWPGPVGPPA
jgi:hypothetical protein